MSMNTWKMKADHAETGLKGVSREHIQGSELV